MSAVGRKQSRFIGMKQEVARFRIIMRKENWRFVLESIGLVAVVGSVALVAVELSQNNELMAAEARYNRLGASTQNLILLVENSPLNLVQTIIKPPSEHTAEESTIMESFWFIAFSNANWTFSELPREEYPTAIWERRWGSETARNVWHDNKIYFSEEFVDYIDTVILGN
jgi:hypothetical protein